MKVRHTNKYTKLTYSDDPTLHVSPWIFYSIVPRFDPTFLIPDLALSSFAVFVVWGYHVRIVLFSLIWKLTICDGVLIVLFFVVGVTQMWKRNSQKWLEKRLHLYQSSAKQPMPVDRCRSHLSLIKQHTHKINKLTRCCRISAWIKSSWPSSLSSESL